MNNQNLETIRNCLIFTKKKQCFGELYYLRDKSYCAMAVLYKELGHIQIEKYQQLIDEYRQEDNAEFNRINNEMTQFEQEYEITEEIKQFIMTHNDNKVQSFTEIALELGEFKQ